MTVDAPIPRLSRGIKALRALGISTAGIRAARTPGSRTIPELSPPASPANLEQLEAVGYRYGAARTVAELRTIVELGWVDLDHWIGTELASAMREAARCVDGVSMALAPTEARQLARAAALGRIDTLRSVEGLLQTEPDPPVVGVTRTPSAGGRPDFHGGC